MKKEKIPTKSSTIRYLHNGAEWYSLGDNIQNCTIRPYSRDKVPPCYMPQTPLFSGKHPSHVIVYPRTLHTGSVYLSRVIYRHSVSRFFVARVFSASSI